MPLEQYKANSLFLSDWMRIHQINPDSPVHQITWAELSYYLARWLARQNCAAASLSDDAIYQLLYYGESALQRIELGEIEAGFSQAEEDREIEEN